MPDNSLGHSTQRITRESAQNINRESVILFAGGSVCLRLALLLGEGTSVTEGAHSSCQLWASEGEYL